MYLPDNNPLMQGESMQWIPIKPVPKAHAESPFRNLIPEPHAETSLLLSSLLSRVSVDTPSLNSHHGLADYY